MLMRFWRSNRFVGCEGAAFGILIQRKSEEAAFRPRAAARPRGREPGWLAAKKAVGSNTASSACLDRTNLGCWVENVRLAAEKARCGGNIVNLVDFDKFCKRKLNL